MSLNVYFFCRGTGGVSVGFTKPLDDCLERSGYNECPVELKNQYDAQLQIQRQSLSSQFGGEQQCNQFKSEFYLVPSKIICLFACKWVGSLLAITPDNRLYHIYCRSIAVNPCLFKHSSWITMNKNIAPWGVYSNTLVG